MSSDQISSTEQRTEQYKQCTLESERICDTSGCCRRSESDAKNMTRKKREEHSQPAPTFVSVICESVPCFLPLLKAHFIVDVSQSPPLEVSTRTKVRRRLCSRLYVSTGKKELVSLKRRHNKALRLVGLWQLISGSIFEPVRTHCSLILVHERMPRAKAYKLLTAKGAGKTRDEKTKNENSCGPE